MPPILRHFMRRTNKKPDEFCSCIMLYPWFFSRRFLGQSGRPPIFKGENGVLLERRPSGDPSSSSCELWVVQVVLQWFNAIRLIDENSIVSIFCKVFVVEKTRLWTWLKNITPQWQLYQRTSDASGGLAREVLNWLRWLRCWALAVFYSIDCHQWHLGQTCEWNSDMMSKKVEVGTWLVCVNETERPLERFANFRWSHCIDRCRDEHWWPQKGPWCTEPWRAMIPWLLDAVHPNSKTW